MMSFSLTQFIIIYFASLTQVTAYTNGDFLYLTKVKKT